MTSPSIPPKEEPSQPKRQLNLPASPVAEDLPLCKEFPVNLNRNLTDW